MNWLELCFMNEIEKKALKKLEAAFRECRSAGLCFCGMDDGLLYATRSALVLGKEISENEDNAYNAVACAMRDDVEGTGTVKTYDTYKDSGGW